LRTVFYRLNRWVESVRSKLLNAGGLCVPKSRVNRPYFLNRT